jgi:hypothetical protein
MKGKENSQTTCWRIEKQGFDKGSTAGHAPVAAVYDCRGKTESFFGLGVRAAARVL